MNSGQVLTRARVVLSLQLAGAITAVVLLVGSLAFLVTMHRQHTQIDDMLHYTLGQSRTGEVDPCTWLFIQRGDTLVGASAAPPGLPMRGPLRRATASEEIISTSMRANGTRYFVLTQRTNDGTRQAVFDARYQMSDRSELFIALVIAELIGLLIASATGILLARLAIAPLDEALSRQRRFVADASHELRSPLTRLYTRAQLLMRRDLTPETRTEVQRMVDSSRELNEIVDDLLRSAVLTADRPSGEPVDLAGVAASVVASEQPRALAEQVALRAAPAAGPAVVGPAVVGPAVVGVESALRRMVSALVDNALRHSVPGGAVDVTVAQADRGRTVTLTVADNGTGLDPADSRLIFERFHRGTQEKAGSHGLGLALVREIVEAHGGTVSATGRPGAGTAFVVRLPVSVRSS